MRRIILILVLIPSVSCSMDIGFNSAREDEEVSCASIEDQDDNPDRPTPRSARSNSCYVQTVSDVLRRSREMRVDDLAELEEGVGAVSTPRVLTEDQIAEYFFTSMEGQDLPGFGLFNREDKGQCDYLRGLISVIKRVDPERYQSMVTSITRGRRRRYPNTALIEVLNKVVTSINTLNTDSTHVAEQQLQQMKEQVAVMQGQLTNAKAELTLAQQFSANAARRFRLTTVWTVIGGAITVVVTNLIQAYVNHLEANNMTTISQQAQTTTMMQNITMT